MTSLRVRLTVATVAVVAFALAASAWFLYGAVRDATRDQHDRGLAGRARALLALVEYDEGGYEFEEVGAASAGLGGEAWPGYYELWRPDGRVLARSRSLGARDLPPVAGPLRLFWPGSAGRGHAFAVGSLDRPRFASVTLPDGRPGRLVALRAPAWTEPESQAVPGEVVVVLAEGTEAVRATLATVRRGFVLVAVVALALATLLTTLVIARGLRPLGALATALEAIDADSLSARLPVAGQPAELRAPVDKLNELLARLDGSFARERRFTADVSHELRTPLAGLRAILEVTAKRDRSGDEYRRALADATEVAIGLAGLVENLLALARLEAGEVVAAEDAIALRPLVEACWRPLAARAAERGLVWRDRIEPAAMVTVDPVILRLVAANLLANAVEYTEAGGWIEVGGGDGDLVLEVVDSGPPIPAEHLARVFDRMWRADGARSGGGAHAGIGLALVRTACTAHGWDVAAATLDDGRVRFAVSARARRRDPPASAASGQE